MYEYDYVNRLPYFVKLVNDTTVRKHAQASMIESVLFMEKLCNYLIAHPDPTIVPVYGFEYLGREEDGNFHYTYDMEKLYHLSRDEKNVIEEIAADWYGAARLPSESHLEWVRRGRCEYSGLVNFLETVIKLNRYTDINRGNIMLDQDGNYRLIDLESFFHSPIDNEKNLWFQ